MVRSPSSNYNEKVYSLAILEYEETGRPSIVTALKDEDVKDLFMTLIRTDDIGAFNTKMKRLINQREFGDIINNDNVDFIQEFSEFERILREEINKTTTLSISSIANINTSVGLEHEFQAQIDHAQRLIKTHNPQQALDYLVELKKRIWRRANRNIKYDILSNLASANFELMNFPETAENVVSALQYNPEDDKAIGNCALGYFLILENEKAKELISKAVKKNELSVWSWTNYINIFSKEKTPSDFLRIIPKSIQKKPSIAFALGIAFKQRKQFQKAMEWLEVAYKDKDSIELKAELGLLIIEMKYNDFSKLMGEQISETDKNDINRAIQLLADAWNLVKNRDLAIVKSHWIFEISRAKFLIGDYKGGLRDVSEAIEIKPNNSYYLKLRGLIQYQMGHYENAIRDLKSIADDKSISDRFLVLAGFLRTNKQIDDAIALLEESLRIEEKKSIKSDEKRLLIDLYCEREDFEKAEQLLNSIPENVKDNILWLISSSKVKRLKGEIEKGKEILIYALGQITENTSYGEL
ncbi:MAG: tetratricopeptide repeat protein, partial [Bacteroidetes bacterium]|nr:tetratricopeptide repeat protein [Bacteroidota bacterium]